MSSFLDNKLDKKYFYLGSYTPFFYLFWCFSTLF